MKVNEGIIYCTAKNDRERRKRRKEREEREGERRREEEKKKKRGEKRRGRERRSRAKRKWENRGFMAVKRWVLGRARWGEEMMLMGEDLSFRPGGLTFSRVAGRNRFCW